MGLRRGWLAGANRARAGSRGHGRPPSTDGSVRACTGRRARPTAHRHGGKTGGSWRSSARAASNQAGHTTRTSTTAWWFFANAYWPAQRPLWSTEFHGAPYCSSTCTASTWPPSAAAISALTPPSWSCTVRGAHARRQGHRREGREQVSSPRAQPRWCNILGVAVMRFARHELFQITTSSTCNGR